MDATADRNAPFSIKADSSLSVLVVRGELVGMLAAGLGYAFMHPKPVIAALLMIPLIIDGLVQALTAYTSTNGRRFMTGVLFGYGLVTLFLFSVVQAFLFGYHLLDT